MPRNQEAGQRLTIGQFAEIALLSPKALRLYDERRLLRPAWTDPVSGYRYYAPDQADTGRLISLLRGAGVSLPETEGVVKAESPKEALEALANIRDSMRSRSEAAEALLDRASLHLPGCRENRPDSHHPQIVEMLLEDAVVLTTLSPVDNDRLDEHMASTIQHLKDVANRLGVPPTGHPFGVFHGPVGEDTDGPLEIALPVARMTDSIDDVRCYRITGGQMATVRTTGADTEYPAILAAYDLTCSWIENRGFNTTGPPREIWEVLPWEGKASMTIAWPFADSLSRLEKS